MIVRGQEWDLDTFAVTRQEPHPPCPHEIFVPVRWRDSRKYLDAITNSNLFQFQKYFLWKSVKPCQSRLRSDLFADNHLFPIHSESHLLLNHRLGLHLAICEFIFALKIFEKESTKLHVFIFFPLKSFEFTILSSFYPVFCIFLVIKSFEIVCTKASSY